MEKMSILVCCFDGYSDAWSPMTKSFEKFWSDCSYERYFATGNLECPSNSFKTIKCGKDFPWARRIECALSNIKSKYVLLLMEDYFLISSVKNDDIEMIIEFMEKNEADYLRLSASPGPKEFYCELNDKISIGKVVPKSQYCLNLQASIWKKEYLQHNIANYDTPWEVEYLASKNCNKNSRLFSLTKDTAYSVYRDISTEGAIQGGKWTRKAYRYMIDNGISFSTRKIKVESIGYYYYKRFKCKVIGPFLNVIKKTGVYDFYRKRRYERIILKEHKMIE